MKSLTDEKKPRLGHLCIEKDTRKGVLYAPCACVLMVEMVGICRNPLIGDPSAEQWEIR